MSDFRVLSVSPKPRGVCETQNSAFRVLSVADFNREQLDDMSSLEQFYVLKAKVLRKTGFVLTNGDKYEFFRLKRDAEAEKERREGLK